MPVIDLLVRGANVILPKGSRKTSLAIHQGKVVGHAEIEAATVIDAEGLTLLPGAFDAHVHYNEPGRAEWEGWGTALKPAHEPIVVARKPVNGTIAQNVMTWGTGAINIDGCRVKRDDGDDSVAGSRTATFGTQETVSGGNGSGGWEQNDIGRFPANFIHDGSDEVLQLFPNSKAGKPQEKRGTGGIWGKGDGHSIPVGPSYGDDGSAARFFYCAKPSTAERNAGLDGLQKKKADTRSDVAAGMWKDKNAAHQNHHPTVKPITLMRYLIRMVVPPNGIVLDPFLGSGTTGVAAIQENIDWIGFEMNPDYADIAHRRTGHASF